MTKRSLHQIQESLAEQFYKYRRRGDDPGPEMGGGSFGLGSVTRSSSQFGGGANKTPKPPAQTPPPPASKPRVSVQQAKDMGIIKTEPKVWRTPDGKSSSKPPKRTVSKKEPVISAERSSRSDIPGLSAKEKRSAVKKSAAVHGAAAVAATLGLINQKDTESSSAAAAADTNGVTWVDTQDFGTNDTVKQPASVPIPVEKIQEPDVPLEPVELPITSVVVPDADQSAADQQRTPLRPTSVPSAPATGTGDKVGTQTGNDYKYKPGYTGLPFKESLKEKYTNFLNEETAKEKFLQRVIGAESGGNPTIKNSLSSATGLFQITKGTWKGIVAKAKPGDPHYGVSFEEMPQNVPAQYAAARQIADEYARTIKRSGLPDTPTSYYLLHGHGTRAVEIYKNPDKQLKDIYPEYVRNKKGEMVKNIVYVQNPNFKPEQRLVDFVAKRARQMGDKLTDVYPGATAGELPAPAAEKSKTAKSTKADKKTDTATPKLEPIEQKPIGTLVQPDYSKYNVGDLGPLEKIGPGKWRSSKGKIVTGAPELENLPTMPKPESFTDKLKRVAPPALGGGGELVSQVFGDRKKSTAPTAAPVLQPEPKKTDPAYEPGTAEYDARMEKLQIAAGDKFSREREARLKAAAEKPADGIELQRDQTGLVKAKRELSDFERAFAAARAEKGAGGTFQWTNPRTGKTGTYGTLYKGETPPAKAATPTVVPAAITPANTGADSVAQSATAQSDQGLGPGEELVNIPVTKSTSRAQDLERIIKQAEEPVSVPAARTADQLASDELWKDTRNEWGALSQDEQQQRIRDAKLSQAGFNDLVQTPELKESINTASHAELHDILRLAGRIK